MALGGSPDQFWKQTPRTFIAITEGMVRAAKRDIDRTIAGAWHGEAFARTKRLKKLGNYVGDGPAREGSSAEALSMFRAFKKQGLPIKIKRLN